MLTVLILVCNVAVTPDLRDCTRDNAVDVMRTTERFASPAMCGLFAQAQLASTEIGRDLRPDERVRVVCGRV